ncbi:hypothetical protein ACIXRX_17920 [Bacteroides fragilis]
MMFDSWIRYLDDTINKPETMIIHKEILKTYDSKVALQTLKSEYTKFCTNPIDYIDNFITLGQEHVLANLDTSGIETYIDKSFLEKYIVKKYGRFFSEISRNNFRANVWRSLPSIKRVAFGLKKIYPNKKLRQYSLFRELCR